MIRAACYLSIVVIATLALVPNAHAHPLLDRAEELQAAADFDAALALLTDASSRDDLTRQDVLRLLELRARIQVARGNADAASAALSQLLALNPAFAVPENEHPGLRRAFAEARTNQSPFSLEVDTELNESRLTLTLRMTAPEGLVRTTELRARSGDADWRSSRDGLSLELEVTPGDLVQHLARAEGPGGAELLAERGELLIPTAETALFGQQSPTADEEEGGFPWGWAILGFSVAAVAAGVILLVLYSSNNATTQFVLPANP